MFRSNKSISVLSKFNEQQDIVKQLVSDAKFGFEERIALNIKENPRAFFSYVRSKQKGKDAAASLREPHSDSIITDSQGIANLLNDYFVWVFTRGGHSSFTQVSGWEWYH